MAKLYDQITQLLDGSVDAAVVLDGERRVLHYNPAYEGLTGLRGRQLAEKVKAGAHCYELFKLEICEKHCLGCKVREVGRRLRVDEIQARRGDGEDLTFIVTAAPVELDGGERVVVETYRDVTADVRIQRRLKVALEHERRAKEDLEEKVRERTAELRAAQAQLVHQEKMSSLGRLVAGIAHELNNPINFVYGNVDFLGQYMEDLLRLVALVDTSDLPADLREKLEVLKREVELDFLVDDWRKLLRSIRAGAERTADIVADLKSFARTGGTELGEADIVGGIDTTLNLIGPLLKNRVEVRRNIVPGVPRVLCNAGHVNQVFMNILTNAAQAITGTGWIEVSIHTLDDGATIRVEICDSGPGIKPELMAKISDPFFTTKEVGEGTGLGLWICANIVRAHGGTLTWGNRPGAGAEFIVTLPVRGPELREDAEAHG
ncbi:MAG: PAS domain-containing protein [Kofleriaceae bacterium]|nr:MAG: PAS domain-containing protein [Kofleriaceae bacterium]MBZ0232854.1 PAS domain S-box protein [Kofleriaceae bacterium]